VLTAACSEPDPEKFFELVNNVLQVLLAKRWIQADPEPLVHDDVGVVEASGYAVIKIPEVGLAGQVACK
jgi:hypothetical protein